MTQDQVAALLNLQRADGAFGSVIIDSRGQETIDVNGFTAAIVLRQLRHAPRTSRLEILRSRALDWLESCRSRDVPGAFGFWPDCSRPAWAAAVPADVDDTTVMLLELLRHGRIERRAALSAAAGLLPCRVEAADLAALPPWVAEGSFYTWIVGPNPAGRARKPLTNIVDCCVNSNVAALFAYLGLCGFPGQDAAAEVVIAGLSWAGTDERRLAAITPFYPSSACLTEAVSHAVECGATALVEAQDRLAALPGRLVSQPAGLCRDAYGHCVWHAPAVDLARQVAHLASI